MKLDTKKIDTIQTNLKAGARWYVGGVVLAEGSDDKADLSNLTAKMEFRDGKNGKVLATLTHDLGITLLDGSSDHNYEIDLSSVLSMGFNDSELVLSDFFIMNGVTAFPIFNVQLRIERTQTQWITQTSPSP